MILLTCRACAVAEKRGPGGLFKKKSSKPARAMDDSGVDSMQKQLGGAGAGTMPPLRRQASDTNLTSSAGGADYRTGAKPGQVMPLQTFTKHLLTDVV